VDKMLTWRKRLKAMQSVKVSLLRKEFRKRGQLGAVKLLPRPPSKALGNEELPAGVLIMEVAADDAEVVATPLCGPMIEDRPVAVGATAVAGEENLGR